MAAIPLSALAASPRWQTNFLAVLPAVQTHASIQFGRLRPEAREEATAATVARAFVDYGHLAKRHRLAHAYAGTLASYAVRRVRAHRSVGGHQTAKDVLSPIAQKRHGFTLASLSPWDAAEDTWREVVVESRRVSPADRAAFDLDFAQWLSRWPARHRRLINGLAASERVTDLAKRFRVSLGRISQLRRRYAASWQKFQGVDNGMQVA
jgi:hypothetical protein